MVLVVVVATVVVGVVGCVGTVAVVVPAVVLMVVVIPGYSPPNCAHWVGGLHTVSRCSAPPISSSRQHTCCGMLSVQLVNLFASGPVVCQHNSLSSGYVTLLVVVVPVVVGGGGVGLMGNVGPSGVLVEVVVVTVVPGPPGPASVVVGGGGVVVGIIVDVDVVERPEWNPFWSSHCCAG